MKSERKPKAKPQASRRRLDQLVRSFNSVKRALDALGWKNDGFGWFHESNRYYTMPIGNAITEAIANANPGGLGTSDVNNPKRG